MRDGCAVHFSTCCQLTAGVESEPSHPEDEHTEGSQGEVVTRNGTALAVLAVLAQTGTEGDGADECQHTTHTMHDGRTGKVVEHITKGRHHERVGSIVAKPTAAPSPMAFHGIDDERDESAIHQIHGELRAFSHRTAHDGGGGGTEDGLENQETFRRQVALVEGEVAPVGQADESAQDVAAEHQAEADKEEQQGAEHEIDKVLHQDVCRVLTACETCLTQGKTWLHPEN